MGKPNILFEAAATYTTLNIDEVVKLCEKRTPLVHGYPPKPAFIQMDKSGKITSIISDNDAEGIKDYIFDGLTMRWQVPSTIFGGDLYRFNPTKSTVSFRAHP